MIELIKRLFSRWKVRRLNRIAACGVSPIGFYSWDSVYEAFRDAGLSEEEARRETDKRVWSLD